MQGVEVDGGHLFQHVSEHFEAHLRVLRPDRGIERFMQTKREQGLVQLPEEQLQTAGDLPVRATREDTCGRASAAAKKLQNVPMPLPEIPPDVPPLPLLPLHNASGGRTHTTTYTPQPA